MLTGVTRGLGLALARYFSSNGQLVLGCGRDANLLKNLKNELGESPDLARVDVANAHEVDAWAQHLLSVYGPPDILINNAAVINTPASLWEIGAAEFDQLIKVNILGVANVIRAFVPAMVKVNSGVIVNLSSGWGRSTSPNVAPYCASKYAIEGLTKSLAQELPNGMAAIPLNPGIIDTDMLRLSWAEEAGRYIKPEKWVQKAGPFILGLGPKDTGKSANVPN